MEHRLSATELARNLGDVLGRIRYRGDTFLIERNGSPVARIVPLPEHPPTSLREAVAAWRGAGEPDLDFADALDRVAEADRPPESPWAS
ncbi:MAG: type II toxin-antitoxin system Phd/YefM family antitoxin [Gemmatimonadetes bacterium]|nr:type II toxin-antitoxin system Phd/YefM family antitoxin [Gemmatimonadota bacterium]